MTCWTGRFVQIGCRQNSIGLTSTIRMESLLSSQASVAVIASFSTNHSEWNDCEFEWTLWDMHKHCAVYWDLLANAKGHIEAPLERRVFVKLLKSLHAQISIARLAKGQHWFEQPAARLVGLTLSQRSMASALVDSHRFRFVLFNSSYIRGTIFLWLFNLKKK